MYVNGVANESAPDPSVTRAWLELPSVPGNLKVLLADKVSAVSYTHLTLPTIE